MELLLSGTPPYRHLSNTVTLLFLAWQNGHTFSNEKTLLTKSPVDVANGGILKSQTVSYIEDITRWHEEMNFIFKWQNNIL